MRTRQVTNFYAQVCISISLLSVHAARMLPRFFRNFRRHLTRGWRLVWMGVLVVAWGRAAAQSPSPEAAATIVVFNSSDPQSLDLAKYYAKRRAIPQERLIGLAAPLTEEISRQEYNTTLAAPLRAELIKRKLWTENPSTGDILDSRVRFVALIRGIPLKIRADETIAPDRSQPEPIALRNEASVDSELMTLSLSPPRPAGILENPYFRRYTPVIELAALPGVLLVARLDATDPIIVRAMIDDSLVAERDGLWGWGYVDARGITSGSYSEGDRWLVGAVASMRKQGIPTFLDSSEPTLAAGFPVTDAAVYYGWYASSVNGPFADFGFRFRPGGIAVHIHSFSAATLRDPQQGWAGPLLARGASATLGNVYEPYLSLTADLQIFQDRLMAGFTLAESGWAATRGVSWMSVVIGDPLYRPYAAWRSPNRPTKLSSWETYRQIVRAADGQVVAAADKLRAAARRLNNSMFLEALAAAQLDAGQQDAALASLSEALKIESRPPVRFRLGLEEYAILRAQGKTREATKTLSRIATEEVPAQSRALLSALYENINPTPGPTPKMR